MEFIFNVVTLKSEAEVSLAPSNQSNEDGISKLNLDAKGEQCPCSLYSVIAIEPNFPLVIGYSLVNRDELYVQGVYIDRDYDVDQTAYDTRLLYELRVCRQKISLTDER